MLEMTRKLTENEENYKFYDIDIMLDGKKIGYAEMFIVTEISKYGEDFNEDFSYIKSIEIDEEYRNNGYGTKVLTDLAAEFDGIYICPDNENAKRLYARLGEEVNAPECLECATDEYEVMYHIA